MTRMCHWTSPLGRITLTADGEALTGLWFDGQRNMPDPADFPPADGGAPVFVEAQRWLELYFSGRDPGFLPRLKPCGTPFRRTVWEILLTVPYGRTVTYGEIAARAAERLGRPRMSAQAAGGAVGHNPISLIIPCHRVVGADGNLTGYAGGMDRKLRLLRLEGAELTRMYDPRGRTP